ncbi:MAG: penicillin-binding protein 2 [Actinomycetota bacterium]
MRTVGAVFVLVMGGFMYRLADLQLTPDPAYAEPVSNTLRETQLEARRGSLVDRQGRPLAISLPSATIVADPRLVSVEQVPWVVGELAQRIDTDPTVLASRLASDRHFVYLDRQVDMAVGEEIMALDLPGVYLLEEPRRQHPNGACTGLALLGRVDTDHHGISGLEKLYNDRLTGVDGTRAVEVSGFDGRATIVGGEQVIDPAVPGDELRLSLHRDVQFKSQEIIETAVRDYDADLGVVLVMIPATGEVVAAASAVRDDETGTVDCTTNNLPFTHIYEPGSTMKTISIAAVFDAGLATPHERIALEPVRHYALDDGQVFPVKDHFTHTEETYSPTEILTRSSNVGTTYLAERLEPSAMNDALASFGFGHATGVNFPGESSGIVKDLAQSTVALPTTSYGQGVAVTPIQMLSAYNTIANGGVAVEPVLVVDDIGVADPRRVIEQSTANEITAMLREVVVNDTGTGTRAAVPGFDVVGKTGTAWQPCGENGVGYTCADERERHYTPSFAGIVANDNGPQFTVLVMLDNPLGEVYGGGSVAAPVFAEIAAYTARQLRIPAMSAGPTTTAVRADAATSVLAPSPEDAG